MKLYEVKFKYSTKDDVSLEFDYREDLKVRAENMLEALQKVMRKYPEREVKYIEVTRDEPEILE